MKKLLQPALGERLGLRRKKLGYTLRVAAKKAGTWEGNLYRIEAGADMRISTLGKILKAYGIGRL